MNESQLLHSIGSRVRQLRSERGWSRRELCEKCRVSERYLAEIELGRGNPSVISLAQIAEALDTSPAALLTARRAVIALLGLRGAGKSTIGRALAKRMRTSFVELDAQVEQSAGLSLGEIFELHGESHFRRMERDALRQFLDKTPRAVLATGGGVVTDAESFDLLRTRAITVWLRARPEIHWSRVVAQGDQRPMGTDPRAQERLRELLREREPLYQRADYALDASDLDVSAAVREIQRLVKD